MLTYQLHIAGEWLTQNQLADDGMKVRAVMEARGRTEGEVWRVVDLSKPETPAKPAKRARAPRVRKTAAKVAATVLEATEGGK